MAVPELALISHRNFSTEWVPEATRSPTHSQHGLSLTPFYGRFSQDGRLLWRLRTCLRRPASTQGGMTLPTSTRLWHENARHRGKLATNFNSRTGPPPWRAQTGDGNWATSAGPTRRTYSNHLMGHTVKQFRADSDQFPVPFIFAPLRYSATQITSLEPLRRSIPRRGPKPLDTFPFQRGMTIAADPSRATARGRFVAQQCQASDAGNC